MRTMLVPLKQSVREEIERRILMLFAVNTAAVVLHLCK